MQGVAFARLQFLELKGRVVIWDDDGTRILVHSALSVALLAICGCGPNPNGPGSYQAVMQGQQSAEETLKKNGGKLERKQYPLGAAWVIDLTGQQLSNSTFDALKRLDHVAELNLSRTNTGDAEMTNFADSKLSGTLVKLDLSDTKVTDKGLQQLKECQFLMNLNLNKTSVTEAGVTEWKKNHAVDPRIAKVGLKIER